MYSQIIKPMKKLFFVFVTVTIVGILPSCGSKCHTCSNNTGTEYCESDYTSGELSSLQSACEYGGGTWN